MYNIYSNVLFTVLAVAAEEEKKGIGKVLSGFLKKIWEEIVDLFEDFAEVFSAFKKVTYDVLVEKFGAVGVTVLLAMSIIVIIMVVATVIIRK